MGSKKDVHGYFYPGGAIHEKLTCFVFLNSYTTGKEGGQPDLFCV